MSDDTTPPPDEIPAWLQAEAPPPDNYVLCAVVSAEVYDALAARAVVRGVSVEQLAGEALALVARIGGAPPPRA